MIALFFAMFL
uniref:Uncharacterized protein n=1 Tax=Lepeophtheirus salmonis TaxID=72036 RepID=A0A0K2TGJ0_LEPSM